MRQINIYQLTKDTDIVYACLENLSGKPSTQIANWKYLLLCKRDTEELLAYCKLRKLFQKHISKVIIKLLDSELEEQENLLEQNFHETCTR